MKRVLTIFCLLFAGCHEQPKNFFCLQNGKCVTFWRTDDDICYVIPGTYLSDSKPPSVSYVQTNLSKSIDIIWQKNDNSIIVNLEDQRKQSIHQAPMGVKIVNYNSNKKYNDSLFLYFDGTYHRYKQNVEFMTINVLEQYAYGKDGKKIE